MPGCNRDAESKMLLGLSCAHARSRLILIFAIRMRAMIDHGHDVRMRGLIIAVMIGMLLGATAMKAHAKDHDWKGYGITKTGLAPVYPSAFACSPLTSLYASWTDVDGSRRDEIHAGVDGGRLGEDLLAPGPGVVVAAWKADWGWGDEGALLIMHTREQLNLTDGPAFYFSAFYHLRISDVSAFAPGQQIARGQVLARVFRPGGKKRYLPEVHWEVWEVDDPHMIRWFDNDEGRPDWDNDSADLIDPLYMLARETPPDIHGQVAIVPFENGRDYSRFRGFTYILPCAKV